jgi:hypothetical protein
MPDTEKVAAYPANFNLFYTITGTYPDEDNRPLYKYHIVPVALAHQIAAVLLGQP